MLINEPLLDIEGINKSKLPLIDLFIRRTAVITSTQESLVEKIIKDQWNNASKSTSPSSNISELDFPNLGTFFISKAKAKRHVNYLTISNAGIAHDFGIDKYNEKEATRKYDLFDRNEGLLKSINLKMKNNEC